MTGAKALGVAVGLAAAGCTGDVFDGACTLIGCEDGLAVEVRGELPASYTVTLVAAGEDPVDFECGPAEPCMVPLFARDFTPENVEVRVEGEGLDYTADFTPTYSVSHPNGPDCPPECRQGAIVVTIP